MGPYLLPHHSGIGTTLQASTHPSGINTPPNMNTTLIYQYTPHVPLQSSGINAPLIPDITSARTLIGLFLFGRIDDMIHSI